MSRHPESDSGTISHAQFSIEFFSKPVNDNLGLKAKERGHSRGTSFRTLYYHCYTICVCRCLENVAGRRTSLQTCSQTFLRECDVGVSSDCPASLLVTSMVH